MARRFDTFCVMAGLVPAIHVFLSREAVKRWMPGPSPGMTACFVEPRRSRSDV
jgi:hypothetical protein